MPGRARALEPAGVGAIRDDDRDARRQPPFVDGVDERLKVAAAARDEDADRRARVRHADDQLIHDALAAGANLADAHGAGLAGPGQRVDELALAGRARTRGSGRCPC